MRGITDEQSLSQSNIQYSISIKMYLYSLLQSRLSVSPEKQKNPEADPWTRSDHSADFIQLIIYPSTYIFFSINFSTCKTVPSSGSPFWSFLTCSCFKKWWVMSNLKSAKLISSKRSSQVPLVNSLYDNEQWSTTEWLQRRFYWHTNGFKNKCKCIPSQANIFLQSSQSASTHLALPQLETQIFNKVK